VLPSDTALRVAPGATFDLHGSNQTVGSLANLGPAGGSIANSAGPATLTVGTDNSSTLFSGSINGPINLAKVGPGVLTLAGVQTYSSLFVNDGTVNLNSPLSNATIHESNGTVNVNANTGNLTINSFGGMLNLNGSVTSSLLNQSGGVLNIHANATNSIINADATANIDASQTLAELNIGGSAIVTLSQAPGPMPLADFDTDVAASGLAADPFEAVPEPGTIALLGAGILALLRGRHRPS
jgi:autotransporter-associated beta strand protein